MQAQREGISGHREKAALQAEGRGLRTHQGCGHLELGLPASRLWESKFLSFKPPSLWFLVMAALANDASTNRPAPERCLQPGSQALRDMRHVK